MATKNTKRFTGGLDPNAMYQIGAAGSNRRQANSNEVPAIARTIGNVVLNYYGKIRQNKALVKKTQNAAFASLDNSMKEAGIVDGTVVAIKEKLIGANKILNSVRGSLFPNEQRYKDAQTAANEAEYAMKNLANQYKALPEWEEALTTLFNNELSENGETVGWEHSSTVLEQYNTSLLASGQLKNAIVADGNGDLRVVTWDGKASKTGFDDPRTENKIETAEDYQKMLTDGKLSTVKLSEMEFIKPGGTKQKNHGNDHLGDLTDQGTRGITLTDQELEVFGDDFGTAIETMDNRNFMSYMFDGNKFKFREDDGTSMSIVDKLIKDNTAEWDKDKSGGLDKAEKAAAKEIIKAKILNGSYNKQRVKDLFHNKAKQAYRDKKAIHDEENQPKSTSVPNQQRNNRNILNDAASGGRDSFTFSTKEGPVTFIRVEGTDTFQGNMMGGGDYGNWNLDQLMSTFSPTYYKGTHVDAANLITQNNLEQKKVIQQQNLTTAKKKIHTTPKIVGDLFKMDKAWHGQLWDAKTTANRYSDNFKDFIFTDESTTFGAEIFKVALRSDPTVNANINIKPKGGSADSHKQLSDFINTALRNREVNKLTTKLPGS